MNKFFASMATLSIAALLMAGCSEAPSGNDAAPTVMKTVYESATLCGKCGEVKGSEACCAEGAETCEKCSLHHGAPGCCKIEAGSDVVLCAGCGEVKGGESCCAEGAETCKKCNLHKGAPGCCKLKEAAIEEEATDNSEAS